MTIPTLFTERLILKGLELSDAESYEKNFADYEVIRFLSDQVPWPYPKGGAAVFLDAVLPKQGVSRWSWGIFLKDHPDEVIGCVDLWRDGRPENRGFWLAKRFWGQGLMTEAVEVVTSYAFDELGFEKLVFSNAVGNERSRRVKVKTHAIWVGQRPAGFVDPQFTEAETWELTREVWQAASVAKDNGVADAVSRWLSDMVIGLNLCPFARTPYTQGLVHIEVSTARSFDTALDDVLTHIDALMELSPSVRSTTLLVTPEYFQDFEAFLDAIDVIEAILEKSGAAHFLQLAHFHPDYLFEGVDENDASHFTNRSPYPIFHLIRTEEVEEAVASMPNIDDLPARNIALMREMGVPALLKLCR